MCGHRKGRVGDRTVDVSTHEVWDQTSGSPTPYAGGGDVPRFRQQEVAAFVGVMSSEQDLSTSDFEVLVEEVIAADERT